MGKRKKNVLNVKEFAVFQKKILLKILQSI